MTININGNDISSREEFYNAIERQLPEGYFSCRNLDALWDLCTEDETEIVITNAESLRAALGDYASLLFSTLEEANANNSHFVLTISEEQ